MRKKTGKTDFDALRKPVVLLPFAFMVHNIEEAVTMKSWVDKNPIKNQYPVSVQQFLIAVILFTALGFILVFLKRIYKSDKQYFLVIAGFSGMLLLNVFFPHFIGAIAYRTYMPGLYTAMLINLPLTLYILYQQRRWLLSTKEVLLSVSIGGVVGIVLVKVFLTIGSVLETS